MENLGWDVEKLRQCRTIPIVQMRRQIFRQTNQIDAGNSVSITKDCLKYPF